MDPYKREVHGLLRTIDQSCTVFKGGLEAKLIESKVATGMWLARARLDAAYR